MLTSVGLEQDSLVEKGLELCRKVARSLITRFRLNESLYDELFGQAQLGLVESLRRYDPRLNDNFERYAYIRVRGACIDYLRKCSGLPPYAYKAIKAFDCYESYRAQTPGMSFTEALAVGVLSYQITGSRISGEKVEDLLVDNTSAEEEVLKKDFLAAVQKALKKLTPLERDFVKSCYFKDLTFEAFAKKKKKQKSQITRVSKAAISKIKSYLYETGYFS